MYAFCILAAIAIPWHVCECSCGLRALCYAKRALSDRLAAKFQAKRLKTKWAADKGILTKGTWARVAVRPHSGPKPAAVQVRTVSLADCDPDRIFVASSTLAAPKTLDFDQNDDRQLRRLLRSLNIHTTGRETKSELLPALRYHLDCDDTLFDNSLLPNRLERYQILQACMHLLMYYFAPCNRALAVYWLCRSVAGSGDPADERPEYQHT